MLVKEPHTFADIRDAAGALSAYVAAWSGYLQYDIRAVFSSERAVIGYQVRALDVDGFGVGYLAPEA